jgi:CheY-like chemotaxis protein
MILRVRARNAVVWARLGAAQRSGLVMIAGAAGDDASQDGRTGRVILVVDDHDDTRQMYAQFLDAMGYDTLQAASCEEALRVAGNDGINAVVLDRRLPDGDGNTVCRTLKSDPRRVRFRSSSSAGESRMDRSPRTPTSSSP